MIAIPFFFFLILFVVYIKKNGFLCISTALLGIYVLISFFAIMIDYLDLYSNICPYIDINFGTSLLYCFMLWITMYPFLEVKDNKIQRISPMRSTKYLDRVVYFYFISFIIIIGLTYHDLIKNMVLLSVNDDLKADFRFGREEAVSLHGFSLYIYMRLRFFSISSLILLFYMFYSMAFLKKSKTFYAITFFSSMSCVYDSVLHIDRSAIVYWLMCFILCAFMFYRYLVKRQKKAIKYLGFSAVGIIVCYVVFINAARFANADVSGGDQIINYLGQSYINFAVFIQNLDLPKYTTIHVFPFLNHLIDPQYRGEDWHMYIQSRTGIFIMCFSTFIGEFISNMGCINTIIWCVCFSLLSKWLLFRSNASVIRPSQYFLMFALVCMPYLGIMGSYYHVYAREICTLFFYIIFRISEKRK